MTGPMKRARLPVARRRALLAGIAALALSGCGATEGLFTPSADGQSRVANLLAFGTTTPGAVPAAASKEAALTCPQIEVLDGTAALRNYSGAEQANSSVKYQYSLGDVARECSRAGGQILIKVGVEGRVLLGPAGQPGNFTVPVRVAVRRDSDSVAVASKLYQVPVTVPFGQTQGEFSMVTDGIGVPFVQAHADDVYTILVGFDDNTPKAGAKAPAASKRKRTAG